MSILLTIDFCSIQSIEQSQLRSSCSLARLLSSSGRHLLFQIPRRHSRGIDDFSIILETVDAISVIASFIDRSSFAAKFINDVFHTTSAFNTRDEKVVRKRI